MLPTLVLRFWNSFIYKPTIMKEKLKQIVKNQPMINKLFRVLKSGSNVKNIIPKKTIKGTGNVIKIHPSVLLFNSSFDIVGNNNSIEIDESSYFNNVTFFIRGNNNKIIIDKRVQFKKGGIIWIEDEDCEAWIGEDCTFEETHIAVTEPNSKIHIGKDCMFSLDIDLRTGDSHSILNAQTNERINYAQNITIGDHVWVGAHVSILKGVHIAQNSVIATRAVVTKSFLEPNVLIGGMPSKTIKENINWDRRRILKQYN